MPNGKFEVNSDHPHQDTGVPAESLDLAEENWTWPEAGPTERERIFARYWSHNEGLVWLLQNDPDVPQAIRDEASQWGFPKDEFTDHRHRPHHIYVRQGRRIWRMRGDGKRWKTCLRDRLARRHADGIAVAEFEFDSHAVRKYDPAYPLLRPGYFFISHDPFQLPYRIMVPKCVDGLLVPVACSASHVGYQTLRMEPVFLALGEASGIAAKAAQDANVAVRAVNVSTVQREILNRGGVVAFENAAMKPEELSADKTDRYAPHRATACPAVSVARR